MTLAEFPSGYVTGVSRHLATAAAVSRSPSTAIEQSQDWGAEWWRFSIEVNARKGRVARELSAFFDALGGRKTRFLFEDPTLLNPEGDVGTLHRAPVVNGASQIGNTLVTSGWDASTWALRVGDFFSLGGDVSTRLYRVTADAMADAAGNATLQIVPRLRVSPADQEALEVDAPKVVLRLTGPVPTVIGRADRHRLSFSADEGLGQ